MRGDQIPHPLEDWLSNSPPPRRQRSQMPGVCTGYVEALIWLIQWCYPLGKSFLLDKYGGTQYHPLDSDLSGNINTVWTNWDKEKCWGHKMIYYYVEIIVDMITIRFLEVYVDVQNIYLETKSFSIHGQHLTSNEKSWFQACAFSVQQIATCWGMLINANVFCLFNKAATSPTIF